MHMLLYEKHPRETKVESRGLQVTFCRCVVPWRTNRCTSYKPNYLEFLLRSPKVYYTKPKSTSIFFARVTESANICLVMGVIARLPVPTMQFIAFLTAPFSQTPSTIIYVGYPYSWGLTFLFFSNPPLYQNNSSWRLI